MRKTLLIITALMLVVGLAWGQTTNPCEDERYLKIKEKSLDEMSDREYAYFLKFDEKCTDYLESSSTYSGVKSKEPVAKPIDGNILVKKGSLMYTPDSPTYVATAKIIPSAGGSSTSNLGGLAAQFGVSVPGGEEASITSSWVYPELILSRTLARAMLKRNFDTEEFGPDQSLLKIITYSEDEPTLGHDTLEKNAVKALLGMINVFKDPQSSILSLEVSASEPQLAADIATALIEELDRHQQKIMSTRASEKLQFIAGRIEEVQIDLEKAEQELKEFRDRNRQNQNSPSFLLEQERLSQEVEVVMGVYFTLIQEYEVARIQEVKEIEVVQVLDPPVSPLEMSIPKDKLGEPYSGQAVWYYDNGQKKYERTYKDGKLIESTRWDKDGNE